MGVSIDGTPIEDFQAMALRYLEHEKKLVQESDFQGTVVNRIDFIKRNHFLTAEIYYSNCSDTEIHIDSIDIKDMDAINQYLEKKGFYIYDTYGYKNYNMIDMDHNVKFINNNYPVIYQLMIIQLYTDCPDKWNGKMEYVPENLIVDRIKAQKAVSGLSETSANKLYTNPWTSIIDEEGNIKSDIELVYNERNWWSDYTALLHYTDTEPLCFNIIKDNPTEDEVNDNICLDVKELKNAEISKSHTVYFNNFGYDDMYGTVEDIYHYLKHTNAIRQATSCDYDGEEFNVFVQFVNTCYKYSK